MDLPDYVRSTLGHAEHVPTTATVVASFELARFAACSYLGLNQARLEGNEYLQVVDEFVAAIKARWPNVLIQV